MSFNGTPFYRWLTKRNKTMNLSSKGCSKRYVCPIVHQNFLKITLYSNDPINDISYIPGSLTYTLSGNKKSDKSDSIPHKLCLRWWLKSSQSKISPDLFIHDKATARWESQTKKSKSQLRKSHQIECSIFVYATSGFKYSGEKQNPHDGKTFLPWELNTWDRELKQGCYFTRTTSGIHKFHFSFIFSGQTQYFDNALSDPDSRRRNISRNDRKSETRSL